MRLIQLRLIALVAAVAVATVLPPWQPTARAQGVTLNGAGATFPAPLYTRWFDESSELTGSVISYRAIGSGGGIKGITERTVDFAGSDGIMSAEQEAAAPGVLHIPMTSGAVALVFNLPAVNRGQLQISPDVLARIYLGQITHWNDPALVADNPTLSLPATELVPVHRQDSSGTTYIFTNYLTKISPDWASGPGNATAVQWPGGREGTGNQGVADVVLQTPGAVGYVELATALQNGMTWASLKNSSGAWVEPSLEGTVAAATGVPLPDDMKVMLTNAANASAYPIAGFTWLLVYREQTDEAKGRALVELLWWAIHDAQQYTIPLLYAPLSPEARAKARAQIHSITFEGKPLLATASVPTFDPHLLAWLPTAPPSGSLLRSP